MVIYDCLTDYLGRNERTEIKLTFQEIDEIVKAANNGNGLPKSAYKYRSWWGNDKTHSQAISWMEKGWKVQEVEMKKYVVFEKNIPDE